jgi:hypothetical protein
MTQHEQDTPETSAARPAAKLTVSLTPADLAAVDAVVAQHQPFVRRHAVHLAALRLGLSELRTNPERLVEQLQQQHQRRTTRS